MTTDDDERAGTGPTRRLLSSIRDVLFDSTSHTPTRVSTNSTFDAIPRPSEVDAARAVLRAAIEAQLGPGIREFSLQNEALSEVLPDASLRHQTALRVLALKGTTREQLRAELENALGTLDAQGQSFARKLSDRREALAAAQQSGVRQCHEETAGAEQTIAQLQVALDAQRALIVEAQTRRDQQIAAAESALADLALREQAFQRAYQEIQSEYVAHKVQLSRESL